ncbi:hypothetical protein cyc_05490 [Cyclospora cayetanensis]|uniref:Uncharacterized protein n=1 Tax=Cyclospora cayetanensis TaxID=88456 RepID=A0A1D3D2M4_9EIME|nr:hypothetical protein cyc_05490 [Cyclospora cayetanensis]
MQAEGARIPRERGPAATADASEKTQWRPSPLRVVLACSRQVAAEGATGEAHALEAACKRGSAGLHEHYFPLYCAVLEGRASEKRGVMTLCLDAGLLCARGAACVLKCHPRGLRPRRPSRALPLSVAALRALAYLALLLPLCPLIVLLRLAGLIVAIA